MFGKILGNATVGTHSELLNTMLLENEEVLMTFKFMRDELTLTSKGLYYIDVQGITGSKIQIEYFPIKSIDSVAYETAGTLDLDSDLYIHVRGRKMPIDIKISKSDQETSMEVIKIMKSYYFN